ncbi:MAG: E2/UBC family protein [Methyloceanibacter sp.]
MSFLPEADREYLTAKNIIFEEVEDGGKKGVVLKGRPLPGGRFNADAADILILLPRGYPDIAPDMFHLLPWVKLVSGNKFPKAADQAVNFGGKRWQRWSRHNKEWRPGTDGIWTMIKRIDDALEKAA